MSIKQDKAPKREHIDIDCSTPFLMQLKQDIKAIAKNKGIPMAVYIKSLLVAARESEPFDKRRFSPD